MVLLEQIEFYTIQTKVNTLSKANVSIRASAGKVGTPSGLRRS